MLTFQDIISFEEECIAASRKLIDDFDAASAVSSTDENADLIRATKNVYHQNLNRFFIKRSEFILLVIKSDIPFQYFDVLRVIIRGLMEVYCRVLYLNQASDQEKVEKIIYQEFYILSLTFTDVEPIQFIKESNEKLIQHLALDIPLFEEFNAICQASITGTPDDLAKKYRKLRIAYDFDDPSWIIRNHYDEAEQPSITAERFIYFWKLFSEQSHSNFFLETDGDINPKHQVLALLITLHLKFLMQLLKSYGIISDPAIESLISRFQEPAFQEAAKDLWIKDNAN